MTIFDPLPKRYPLWRTWTTRKGGWTVPISLPDVPLLRLAIMVSWQPCQSQYQVGFVGWVIENGHSLRCRDNGLHRRLGNGPMLRLSSLLAVQWAAPGGKADALTRSRLDVEALLLNVDPKLRRCVHEQIATLSEAQARGRRKTVGGCH